MNIEITGKGTSILNKLAEKKGCSERDVLVYALTLFDLAMNENHITTVSEGQKEIMILKGSDPLISLKSLK